MTAIRIAILASFCLIHHLSVGQTHILDSCGVDSKRELNRYEIKIVDSLFIPPIRRDKSETIDAKNGFVLNHKKIAFYSCAKNSNTKGNGLMSKKEFFELCRPNFKGHAGRGIIIFTEKEKQESKGFDAVLIIDCPYDLMTTKKVVSQLSESYQ